MSAASSATLPPMQRVMWTCKPGKVEEATCSKARLYDAARPQFSPYIGEVVKLRSQFAEERRQAMLRASNLKHKYFVGQRVVVKGIGPAVVSYIGEVAEYDGELMGVQFPGPLGNSDGSLGWMRYFKAEPDHAAFVRFSAVEPLWHNTALPPLPQEVARIPSEASQKQRALAEAMSPGVRRLRRAERNRREKQDAVVGRLRTACRERDAVAERHERQVLAERAHFVENEARTLLKQRHIEEARRLEHDLASYYRDTARRVGAASVQLNQMRNAWQRLPPLKSAPQHSDLSARTEDDLRKEAAAAAAALEKDLVNCRLSSQLAERAHFVENEVRTLLKQRHIEEAGGWSTTLASYHRDTARRVGVQLNQMRNAWQRLPPLKSAPQHSDLSARTEDVLKEAV